MDNDDKVTKPRKTRTTKAQKEKLEQQKSKESIVAAAEEVLISNSMKADNAPVAVLHNQEAVHQQVTVLLENELTRIASDDMKKSFDMETEYAKAKKNSLAFTWVNMWIRLLICGFVVAVLTVILVMVVNNYNKKIPVNVKGFENVKLNELLNDVDKIDSQIKEEERKKFEYEEKRSAEIEKVEKSYSAEKAKIENAFVQEKRKLDKAYSADKNKLESKTTKGLFDGMNKEKNLQKNEQKYNDGLAAAQKRRTDSLAIAKNKYRDDLSRAKNFLKVEIEECKNTISMLKEDRYRFDNNKVQLEAEYDGRLKDKDLQHKREMDDRIALYESKLNDQKNEYEKKIQEIVAADLERENTRLEETINSYDPVLVKDAKIKKVLKDAGNNVSYSYGNDEKNSVVPKEGTSEAFRKVLTVQKEYYEDIDYISSLYDQFPHDRNRAVSTYSKALKSLSSKAGNEIYAASVSEINRVIDEKNSIDGQRKTALKEKAAMQEEYNAILESICGEMTGNFVIDGVVVAVNSEVGYKIYIAASKREKFISGEYKGCVFPVTIFRKGMKVAIGNIDAKGKGKLTLSNVATAGGMIVRAGDRIVMGEPYRP